MKKIAFALFVLITISFFLAGCHEILGDRKIDSIEEDINAQSNDLLFKKKEKCPVCHYQEDQNTYKKIWVNCGKPMEAHLNHGDGSIGDEVPTAPGFVFGENCELVELIAECPCFDSSDLSRILSGRVDLCDNTDLFGFFSRSGSARQNMLNGYCQYINRAPTATTTAQQNGCLQLLMDAIDTYRAAHPLKVYVSDGACAKLGAG